MILSFAVLMLFFIALTRITVQIDLHRQAKTQVRFCVHAGGLHKTWMHTHLAQSAIAAHSTGNKIFPFLYRARDARRFFLRHLTLQQLDSLLLLRSEDAAKAATMSAALQGALCCLPVIRKSQARIRVLPDFFRPHSTWMLRCIVSLRLGTLILTAGLLLLHWFREQQATESEAM